MVAAWLSLDGGDSSFDCCDQRQQRGPGLEVATERAVALRPSPGHLMVELWQPLHAAPHRVRGGVPDDTDMAVPQCRGAQETRLEGGVKGVVAVVAGRHCGERVDLGVGDIATDDMPDRAGPLVTSISTAADLLAVRVDQDRADRDASRPGMPAMPAESMVATSDPRLRTGPSASPPPEERPTAPRRRSRGGSRVPGWICRAVLPTGRLRSSSWRPLRWTVWTCGR